MISINFHIETQLCFYDTINANGNTFHMRTYCSFTDININYNRLVVSTFLFLFLKKIITQILVIKSREIFDILVHLSYLQLIITITISSFVYTDI